METSIEALLSRKRETEEMRPVERKLYSVRATRPLARALHSAFVGDELRAQWANLPPVVAYAS